LQLRGLLRLALLSNTGFFACLFTDGISLLLSSPRLFTMKETEAIKTQLLPLEIRRITIRYHKKRYRPAFENVFDFDSY
jgi:hypothetical protein